ncbi:uncharacterized protein MYCFIDRAFT_172816 [Pseudocercospora fijiensis CIRAD86]|uniref:Uncharacterized protein n=1 Tax=Pseudocercospora fijiensis (strain CIRAD86) TaxID=383855 RepID=M3AGR9_PSEFD|nr:uncharacterized protein MYCFIDRAFT_172816 [Pseudocercospora fijiensis CIRAD86]EME83741.1 hypothetical protein MYCFIDRAFT_172816 [Pseudocercospora fijiensis CIRAD86]
MSASAATIGSRPVELPCLGRCSITSKKAKFPSYLTILISHWSTQLNPQADVLPWNHVERVAGLAHHDILIDNTLRRKSERIFRGMREFTSKRDNARSTSAYISLILLLFSLSLIPIRTEQDDERIFVASSPSSSSTAAAINHHVPRPKTKTKMSPPHRPASGGNRSTTTHLRSNALMQKITKPAAAGSVVDRTEAVAQLSHVEYTAEFFGTLASQTRSLRRRLTGGGEEDVDVEMGERSPGRRRRRYPCRLRVENGRISRPYSGRPRSEIYNYREVLSPVERLPPRAPVFEESGSELEDDGEITAVFAYTGFLAEADDRIDPRTGFAVPPPWIRFKYSREGKAVIKGYREDWRGLEDFLPPHPWAGEGGRYGNQCSRSTASAEGEEGADAWLGRSAEMQNNEKFPMRTGFSTLSLCVMNFRIRRVSLHNSLVGFVSINTRCIIVAEDSQPLSHSPHTTMQFKDDDDEMLPLGREPSQHLPSWRRRGPRAPEDGFGLRPAYFSREYSTWWEKAYGFPIGSVDVACRHHIGGSTYEQVLEKLIEHQTDFCRHHGIEEDEDGSLLYPPAEILGTKAFKAKMEKQNDPNARRRKRNEELRTQREFEEYEALRRPPTPLDEVLRQIREEEIKHDVAEKAAANGSAPKVRARLNTNNIPQQTGQPGGNQRRSPERPPPTYSPGYQRRSPERPPPTYSPPRGTPPSYAAAHGIRRRGALAVRRPRGILGPPRIPTPEFERVEHPNYDSDDFLAEPAEETYPTGTGRYDNDFNGLRRSNAVRRPVQYSGIRTAYDPAPPRDNAMSRPVRRSPSWERNSPYGRRSSIQRTPPRVEVVPDNIPRLFGYDGPPRTPQRAFSYRRTPPPTPQAEHVRRVPSDEIAVRRSRSFSPSPPSSPTRGPPRRSRRIAAGRVQKRSP